MFINDAGAETGKRKFVCNFEECIYHPSHTKSGLCKEESKFLKTASICHIVSDCDRGLVDTHMSTKLKCED